MKFLYKVGIEKVLIIAGAILSCVGVGVLTYTYSKYVTGTSGSAGVRIARWNLTVNDQDIVNNSNFSSVIEPEFPGTSHIASGVIAPTAEGYFVISIDGSDTDVSFSYTITTSDNQNSAVSDLILTGYSIDNGPRQTTAITNGHLSITNNVLYTDLDKDVDITIYFAWNDDSTNGATMDNSDDTDTTTDSSYRALINVNVNFVQLANTPAQNNNNNNNNNNEEPNNGESGNNEP